MQKLSFILFIIFSINLNAQNMSEIQNTVTKLFVATDQQDWETLEKCFAKEVILDYASMTGNPAVTLAPKAIIESWQGVLPGFEHTHHQLGNFLVKVENGKASVFCYGTATHYLTNDSGNIWAVVGTYDFDLVKDAENWTITKMKFNFKYQSGNTALPQRAMERTKK